jgi:hypothetical protein
VSIYYNFYFAKKKEDKFAVIAPFMYNSDEKIYDRIPLKSLCDTVNWTEFMFPILPDEVHTDDIDWLYLEDVYACPFMEMLLRAETAGLRQGYVKFKDFKKLKELNYIVNTDFDMISPEVFAEMASDERKGYGKVAIIATNSVDYIASLLVDMVYPMIEVPELDKYYFICKKVIK